ncbi:Chromatin accessibility complex protein 1 [Coemansia furcata]|uniref:Chromatin accessibility complex protein 1 n=1 Tax=Coemansia furcata TaxID=417177 RepID=A0ACC1LK39_9FUNG|nr:Chromatin accessibility complex protein 1 [Coemansia furcata]
MASSSSETAAATGMSNLPAARVRRIIKEDKDIFACGSESLFLISRATEYFIDSLVRESYEFSRLDKRKTVQYKDMAKAVQSIEQYDFLADIIPPMVAIKKIANTTSEAQ